MNHKDAKHFTWDQRLTLERMLKKGFTKAAIASALGKCERSIYYEINRGLCVQQTSEYEFIEVYCPEVAERKYRDFLKDKGRGSFGHWEMDSIMGCKGSKKALLVLTERRTRMGIVMLLEDHTAASVVKAINSLERRFGKLFYKLFKSITVDNGCEFQDFEGIEAAHRRKGKRTIVFFCHPYSAFERGSNENMNRLIRRFFPKGTSFDTVKPEEVRAAERWVNNYPRKLLGWKSAAMLFEKELLSA